MTIDFYYLPGSSPCRSVLMVAKALGVELNLKRTNLNADEHLTPEYIKMNFQHTIPTINDNGFVLWESRAILAYLVEAYGKTDSLYPKDPKVRAVVNQRLYFDMGTLYPSFAEYYYPQLFAPAAPADPEKFKKIEVAFEFLEKFLEGNLYAAGKSLTIADLALYTTVSTFYVAKFDFSKYTNVTKWYKNVEATAPGVDLYTVEWEEFKSYF